MKNLETTVNKKMYGDGDGSVELWLRVGVKLRADSIGDKESLLKLWQLLSEGGMTEKVCAIQTIQRQVLPPGRACEV